MPEPRNWILDMERAAARRSDKAELSKFDKGWSSKPKDVARGPTPSDVDRSIPGDANSWWTHVEGSRHKEELPFDSELPVTLSNAEVSTAEAPPNSPVYYDPTAPPSMPLTPSSYWSPPEQQDFVKYIGHFGRDFAAIAAHMGTKTETMIKNRFQRLIDSGTRPGIRKAANRADDRRARGEDIGPPPSRTPIVKRKYDNPQTAPFRPLAPYSGAIEVDDPGQGARARSGPNAMLMCPYDDCKRDTENGFTSKENLNEHIRRVHSQHVQDSFEEFSDLRYAPDQIRNMTPPLPSLEDVPSFGSTSIATPYGDHQTFPLLCNNPGPDEFPADEWFPLFPDVNTSTHQIIMHPQTSAQTSSPVDFSPMNSRSGFTLQSFPDGSLSVPNDTFTSPYDMATTARQQGLARIPENDFSELNINGFNSMNSNAFQHIDGFAVTDTPKAPDPRSPEYAQQEQAQEEPTSNVGRLWPGIHSQQAQQAAMQKAAQAQAVQQRQVKLQAQQASQRLMIDTPEFQRYLERVKGFSQGLPGVYDCFLDTINDFGNGIFDIFAVVDRITELFNGNSSLIEGFNAFLPHGYCIKTEADSASVTLTTPIGSRMVFPRLSDDRVAIELQSGQNDTAGQVRWTDVPPYDPLNSHDTHSFRDLILHPRPTLRDILANISKPPWTLQDFMAYLSKNHCLETLEFTMDAGRYRKHYAKLLGRARVENGPQPIGDRKYMQTLWQRLVDAYIRPNGSREVNLPANIRDSLLLLSPEEAPAEIPPPPEELDLAIASIYELMEESVLVPFLNSAYRQASHQPEDLALQSLIEWDDQSLPTLDNAPTMTDEGYHSMTKQVNSEIGEEDAVSDADSVRTDNRDSGLPQNVKEQLSTYFAQEILDNIQLANDELANAIDDICVSLPELLREFSTLVENHARPGLEERACIFVRHQRNQIARNLRTILSSKPDGSDAPAARDRIDLLWGEHHKIDENPDDRVTADLAHEIKDPSESLLNLPEIPEARAYLIESSEYRWLLSRIQSMVKTMPTSSTDSDVRRDLIGVIGGGHTIKVELDWHFALFLDEQYERPEDVELQQVLCCSGLADNAYAAPSVEYANLLWPRLGKEMILCLSRGIRKGSVRMSGSLSDGTTVAVEMASQTTIVKATGATASLIEIAEILAWIGAACRASPVPDRLSYCRPRILPDANAQSASCRILFDYPEMPPVSDANQKQTARCWHQMFRNPTVAYGYPVPVRSNNEKGLEVSLSIVACLGATPWVIDYSQTLFLKGFCSLFAPIMQVGQSIIWHFLLQVDGKRMSYNQGLALEPMMDAISWPLLEQSRHFVGWTPAASILAGTKEANYNIQRSASELSKPGVGALSNAVRDAVVFYDTDSQKGWLCDGATALLHVTRAWLSSSYARFVPNGTIDQFAHPSACDGRQSALTALASADNRKLKLFSAKTWITETLQESSTNGPIKVDKCKETWWCWEDLVQLKWNVLEQIHDHMIRLRTSPDTQLQVPFVSKALEGFDLIDILSDNSQIRPRMIDLQSSAGSWLDVANQNETVNIFGSGFGDLIAPVKSAIPTSCGQHMPVPEGLDYLAAPLYVLKDISFRHRTRKDGSVSLGDSTYWVDPETCLSKCLCLAQNSRKCVVSLSQLHSLPVSFCKKRQSYAGGDIFTSNPLGAVIFGNKPSWLAQKKLGKRKKQSDGQEGRNTRPRGSDSGVDLGASSSSGIASSPSHSQPSFEDSGISEQNSV